MKMKGRSSTDYADYADFFKKRETNPIRSKVNLRNLRNLWMAFLVARLLLKQPCCRHEPRLPGWHARPALWHHRLVFFQGGQYFLVNLDLVLFPQAVDY